MKLVFGTKWSKLVFLSAVLLLLMSGAAFALVLPYQDHESAKKLYDSYSAAFEKVKGSVPVGMDRNPTNTETLEYMKIMVDAFKLAGFDYAETMKEYSDKGYFEQIADRKQILEMRKGSMAVFKVLSALYGAARTIVREPTSGSELVTQSVISQDTLDTLTKVGNIARK